MKDLKNQEEDAKEKRGHMIVICGAKGGIGKTMLAINLAISLSKKGFEVGVWDGAFQFGDIDTSMDLQPSFTINDVVSAMDTLDHYTLKNMMAKHKSGVHVLPAVKRPEYAELIIPKSIVEISKLLLHSYDYLIVDTSTGLNEQNLGLIEQADKILLVTTLDLVPIKNTKSTLEVMETLGLKNKVQLIINRSTMDSMISPEKVLEILKIESAYEIPNNAKLVYETLNLGTPLVMNHAKSDVAKAIFKIAEDVYINLKPNNSSNQSRSFFSRKSFHKKR